MTRFQMQLAGSVCLASAVATLPLAVLSALLALVSTLSGILELEIARAVLSVVAMLLFAYMFYCFRRLLTGHFSFTDANPYLLALIYAFAAYQVIHIVSQFATGDVKEGFRYAGILALLTWSVLSVLVGIKVLKLRYPAEELHKPFCFLSIAVGVCSATLILVPLALLLSVGRDVVLAAIFFHGARTLSDDSPELR